MSAAPCRRGSRTPSSPSPLLLLLLLATSSIVRAFFIQPTFSSSSSSSASLFLTGDRRASSKATHSDVTTTSSSSSPVDLVSASVSAPASSSVNLNPYAGGATGASGSGLKTSLDPIGRIDANPQALLEWVKEGRGKLHDAVSLTHAPSFVDGDEEDASVAAAAAAAAAASTAAGVGGSEELARWTLTVTEEVNEGTVLVSIPNVLTLSPVRRKYKLPSGAAGMQLKDLLSPNAPSSSSSNDAPPAAAPAPAAAAIAALVNDSAVSKILEKAVIDERIQRVMDSFPETYWRIKLAVLLVAERMKGPQSYWWPYLRNLPEKYAHMPIFYNNSEFGSIQIPSLMRTVQSRCRMLVNISDGYLRQLSHAGPAENPFLDDVHANDMGWGLCAASSRALRNIPGLSSTPLMVPIIDLCQHAVNPSCRIKDYRQSGGSIQLVAGRDLQPGEALTISYGNLTNSQLLLDYGFTIPNNPHDRFEFTLSNELIKASQKLMAFETEPFGDKRVPGLLQPWQEKVLDTLNLAPKVNGTPYWPPVKMSFGGENRVDGRLLALLRTMYCRDRRLFALSNVTYESLQSYSTDFRISTFERRAVMHALGIATTLLRRLPTTLTEDWKLLTGESLYVGHDEDSRTVLFRPLPESDESRDELMETVTTDEGVVKEYNPYREAELMERREPVISYMGGNMNRCMREILQFRIAQKKILYQVISDICHTMYGHGLVQSVNDMEELEEERQLMQSPEESSRPLTSTSGRGAGRSLESILSWATKTFGDDAGL